MHGLKGRATIWLVGVLVCIGSMLSPFIAPPQTANAWDETLPTCTGIGLSYWDWLEGDSNTGAANEGVYDRDGNSNFSTANGRYVLARTVAAPNLLLIRPISSTVNLEFQRYTDLSGAHYRLDMADGSAFMTNSINDAPVENGYPSSATLVVNPTNTTSTPLTGITCVYTARNITYGSTWDKPFYSANEASRGSVDNDCDALDFGCWMGKVFDTIGDGLKEVMMGVVKAITYLFAPDEAKMSEIMNNAKTFFEAKLGFLVYPLTFIGQMFTAMGDTSNNWCSDSSCSKSFGNFFGSNFTVNLLDFKNQMPTVWTFFTTAIRGLTVLALILAIRKKYMEVLHK